MVLKYSHCFETLEEARAEIERLHELAFSKKPAALADGAKCYCTNGFVRSLGRDNEELIEDCPNCKQPTPPAKNELCANASELAAEPSARAPASLPEGDVEGAAKRAAKKFLQDGETVRVHRCVNGTWQWVHFNQHDLVHVMLSEFQPALEKAERERDSLQKLIDDGPYAHVSAYSRAIAVSNKLISEKAALEAELKEARERIKGDASVIDEMSSSIDQAEARATALQEHNRRLLEGSRYFENLLNRYRQHYGVEIEPELAALVKHPLPLPPPTETTS